MVSKRVRSHVMPNGKRISPCQRCAAKIDRHKAMYGVTDADWPYSVFGEED